jgi:hypothetical protein
MVISKSDLISIVVMAISLFCIIVFHSFSSDRLWNGYTVLYVPADVNESAVLQTLTKNGCKDIVALSSQQIPFISKFSPVQQLSMNSSKIEENYLQRRKIYFFDKTSLFKLYYIPELYERQAVSSIPVIKQKFNVSAGVYTGTTYLWIPPLICLCLFGLFLYRTSDHLFFLCTGLFPVFFCFFVPSFGNAAAVCLALAGLFIYQKIWNRTSALKKIVRTPFLFIFFLLPFILTFATSLKDGILYTAGILGTAAAIKLLTGIYSIHPTARRFLPVTILPADLFPLVTKESAQAVLSCSVGIFLLLLGFLSSSDIFSDSAAKGLYLPSSNGYTENMKFPDLQDYVMWYWDTITFPYRSLNVVSKEENKPKIGESILLPRYRQTPEEITESDEKVFTFGKSFSDSVIKSIDAISYPSIEKILKEQGTRIHAGYEKTTGPRFSIKNVLLLLISFITSCSVLLFVLFGRRDYA